MGDVPGFCLLSHPFLDTLAARQEGWDGDVGRASVVMALRLSTHLIAAQESWINNLAPWESKTPLPLQFCCCAAPREKPANVQRIHSSAAKFHNGWSQQSEEGALQQQPVCP